MMPAFLLPVLILTLLFGLGGCEQSWNNPYPASDRSKNYLYNSFEERPKHLDPARSYSSNEWAFLGQIYEPPLQYHFLKRPYELTPLTATEMPLVQYIDAAGQITDDPDAAAFTDYIIQIQPGIRYQPHPALARNAEGEVLYDDSWPGLSGVFTLNDFPEWGSRELTAADYVHQIKRLALPALQSPVAGTMRDHILGFDEFQTLMQERYDALKGETGESHPWLDLRDFELAGVTQLNETSYRIRIKNRYPQFIYWLAMNFFAPMPWEAERFYALPGLRERNITLDWFPIGTGPYFLTENNPNLRMTLERNPNFRGEPYPHDGMPEDVASGMLADAGLPMPFIDKAIYSLEKESIPRWNKFLQGYYDLSAISSDSFDQAIQYAGGEAQLTDAMRERGIELQTSTATSLFYFGFNMRDDVVGGDSDRARLLRQAIAIAVDFEEFISIFRNGRGLPAHGPLPPGIFGYRDTNEDINPIVYSRDASGRPVRRSIEDAKALLAEAGYANGIDSATGKRLILYYDTTATGPDGRAMLNWYRKQFQKLGIELVIRATDYNRFQEKMTNGTAQLFSWGWNADYPDPENFLFLLYGPNARIEGMGENAANYQNPRFDTLFDQMKYLPNGEERQNLIDDMIGILREDSPWLWGFVPVDYVLRHAWYHNPQPNLMATNTLKYRRIDPAHREALRSSWNQPIVWPVVLFFFFLIAIVLPAWILHRRRERSSATC